MIRRNNRFFLRFLMVSLALTALVAGTGCASDTDEPNAESAANGDDVNDDADDKAVGTTASPLKKKKDCTAKYNFGNGWDTHIPGPFPTLKLCKKKLPPPSVPQEGFPKPVKYKCFCTA